MDEELGYSGGFSADQPGDLSQELHCLGSQVLGAWLAGY